MVDDHGGQTELMHVAIQAFVSDQIVEAIERLVARNQREFAQLVADGDAARLHIGRIDRLRRVAGKKRGEFQWHINQVARGMLRLKLFDGLQRSNRRTEFYSAGWVEVFSIPAIAKAMEGRATELIRDDFGDQHRRGRSRGGQHLTEFI